MAPRNGSRPQVAPLIQTGPATGDAVRLTDPVRAPRLSAVWLGEAEVGYPARMTTPRDLFFAGCRYPAEHQLRGLAVFPFPLSLRMVEKMLTARGLSVT